MKVCILKVTHLESNFAPYSHESHQNPCSIKNSKIKKAEPNDRNSNI
jgi:hypothetical protein